MRKQILEGRKVEAPNLLVLLGRQSALAAVLGVHGTHTVTTLTRHLEAMVQNGHEVRVGFTVGQPLPGQLKHLSCTFCVYVNLFYRKPKPSQSSSFLIPQYRKSTHNASTSESCHLGNRTSTLLTGCTGPHQLRTRILRGKSYDQRSHSRAVSRIHTSSNLLANSSSSSFRSISKKSKCLKGNGTKVTKSKTSQKQAQRTWEADV